MDTFRSITTDRLPRRRLDNWRTPQMTRPSPPSIVIALLALLACAPALSAQPIFSDDFSPPNPFGIYEPAQTRWIRQSQTDYNLIWAYLGWHPAVLTSTVTGLPLPDRDVTVYVFSSGWKELWSVDTTVNSAPRCCPYARTCICPHVPTPITPTRTFFPVIIPFPFPELRSPLKMCRGHLYNPHQAFLLWDSK